ncbi:uncharacterized protein LOC135351584 [Halichondria panicea]|uniref:uncharacterized protein LOC135351584 n=1 Tax=Halichondria panicea TaxID=6063 RepID=UPI00312B54D3
MDEAINQRNCAYGISCKGEVLEDTYETIPPLRILPQDNEKKDLEPATREVSVKVRKVQVNCYAIVTILALVMAILSLIVALVGVSYALIELNNQQGQLSSSSQGVKSQINNLKQQIQISNEQCKIKIELHAQLNDTHQILQAQLDESNQVLQAHLNASNQQIQISNEQCKIELHAQLNDTHQILQAQLDESNQVLQAQLNASNHQIQTSNEQCKIKIIELHAQLNDTHQLLQAQLDESNQVLQAQLNASNQQIQSIFQDVKKIIATELQIGSISKPASSCHDIPHYKSSGEYWIATDSTRIPVEVYCDMNRTSCSCNTTKGWMRVANLDMSDPSQNCPDGFRLETTPPDPLRACVRPEPAECVSTTYATYGVEHSQVCGRVIGYQDKTPDAFRPYSLNKTLSIDDAYVDGVSLTHGRSPRQHIWTFATAHDETISNELVCPCTRSNRPYTGVVPPFIGQDYFCETGSRQGATTSTFYPDDPVWDGQGCGDTSTCCMFNNPPWFCKQLPQPTTDDIELRICADEGRNNEDVLIKLAEIYIR